MGGGRWAVAKWGRDGVLQVTPMHAFPLAYPLAYPLP